ncbi:MAG: thioredoxin family protein [Chloroflexi bacterium]|nr:thioredoxin family protein [Chloroflexota bacterium]
MPGTTTAVTPARYAQGLTYAEFLAQAKVNKDQFEANYKTAQVPADDAAFFERLASSGRASKMLAIGEDWCPDVYRGMPVAVRIAEAAGMELRVFPRDKNLDIMNEFLNRGEFLSIPVVVFYANDLKYIAHWIERPALANEERAQITEQAKKDLPAASEQDLRAEIRKRSLARYPTWQQATVKEIRDLLASKLGNA